MGKLNDFLKEYENKNYSHFHMPGHKSNENFLKNLNFKNDITEIDGADYLYNSNGIIRDLENEIENLYNSTSFISTQGATLTIQTALSLMPKNHLLLTCRNNHISFYNACALLNIDPIIIEDASEYIDNSLSPLPLSSIENYIKKIDKPFFLFITSPNYYGEIYDVDYLSFICHKNNGKLIVDNAHGAYFKFLKDDIHPITLGADIVCDSLHKTLPTLTSSAVLHIKQGLFEREEVKYKMSLFGSSSPSYLTMSSIDLMVDWLKTKGKYEILKLEREVNKLKSSIKIPILKSEPFKITIDCRALNISAKDVFKSLKMAKIMAEFYDDNFVVLMVSPFNSKEDFKKLKSSLENISFSKTQKKPYKKPYKLKKELKISDATFKEHEKIPIDKAVGKISSKTLYLFPPGVPIILAGEVFNESVICKIKNSGLFYVYVVK